GGNGVAVSGGTARREGDGRGRRRRHPLHLLRDPGRLAVGRRRDRLRQLQPGAPRVVDAPGPRVGPRERLGDLEVIVSGTKQLPAARDVVWNVINEPSEMAKLMPGVESFEIQDEKHWTAKVKVPLGLGGLKMTMNFEKLEEREPEFASMRAKG